MSRASKWSKEGDLNQYNSVELQKILTQLVSGRISVSDRSRRKKIRIVKAILSARMKAEQTLLGLPATGVPQPYSRHHYKGPTTQDFLNMKLNS